MAWVYILIAGLLETAWAMGLKYSAGFSRLWPSVFTLAAMGASFYLLALGMRTLPVGTAYAVWTGIGAVGAVLLGAALFGEVLTVSRLLFVVMIVVGMFGLKASSGR